MCGASLQRVAAPRTHVWSDADKRANLVAVATVPAAPYGAVDMNRITTRLSLVLAIVALAASGCGGDKSKVDAGDASAAIAKAAGVKLTETTVPKDAAKEGLDKAYSNQATAAADKQLVLLFSVKDKGTLDKIKKQLKKSVPGNDVKLYTHENLVVVYAAAGTDTSAKVKAALDDLKS